MTLNEIKRLGDTGISRYNNVDAFLVGAASNPAVQNQLKQIGIKYDEGALEALCPAQSRPSASRRARPTPRG